MTGWLRRIQFWYWDWTLRRAEERMRGCAHRRTTFVHVGARLEKCLDCWALYVPKGNGWGWSPNTVRPPKEET